MAENVQKSVMHVPSCCFTNINLLPSCRSLCRRCRRCLSSLLLWSKNFAAMVTWRHTSLYFGRSIAVADPDLHIRGEGVGKGWSSRPWDKKGAVFFFLISAPRVSVRSKNKWRPWPLPLIRHWIVVPKVMILYHKRVVWINTFIDIASSLIKIYYKLNYIDAVTRWTCFLLLY